MGTVYIEEYASVGKDFDGNFINCVGRLLAVQKVTSSGTTARTSSDFNEKTRYIVISSDANECYKLGNSSVEATANDSPLNSGSYRALEVFPLDDNPELEYTENPTRIAFINR